MTPLVSTEAIAERLPADHMASIGSLLQAATTILTESGSDSPSIDADVLLCHGLKKDRSYLFTWPEKVLSPQEIAGFVTLLQRRAAGEPIAYITGEREFWSLPLKVSQATLIPRPDTERLVELALDKAPSQPATLLDLGTGTGAIALALASELGKHRILAIDIRPEAVQLAQQNARSLDLDNVQFLQGSWFAPLKNWQPDWDTSIYGTKFALIVSNPPYIEKDDPHLQQGDVRFEPLSALVAEEQGLADIRLIARDARDHLTQGGWLLFEHGREQGEAVRCVMDSYGYVNIVTEQDYAGSDRVTLAQYFSSTPTG